MILRHSIYLLLGVGAELIAYIILRLTGKDMSLFALFIYAAVGMFWNVVCILYSHYAEGNKGDPEWEAYKKVREAQQQEVRRREALDEKLCSKNYTQAEKEYLIYTADLSTEQKNILREKHRS